MAVDAVHDHPAAGRVAAIYLIAVRLHIIDSHFLLILANSLFGVPLAAWLMKGFFDEIPYAIEEAAHMDGASWFRAVTDNVLPLVIPGLASVALFVAVFTWNELIFADALQLPMEVPEGEELGARGTAICAGIGAGVYRDHAEAVERAVRLERRQEPDPEATPLYLARYAEYQRLLEAMQVPWDHLSQLSA